MCVEPNEEDTSFINSVRPSVRTKTDTTCCLNFWLSPPKVSIKVSRNDTLIPRPRFANNLRLGERDPYNPRESTVNGKKTMAGTYSSDIAALPGLASGANDFPAAPIQAGGPLDDADIVAAEKPQFHFTIVEQGIW